MNIRGRGAQAEAVAFDEAGDEIQRAETRGRASIVTQEPGLPLELPLHVVTQRDALERARAAAERITALSSAVRDGKHFTGQVKSMQDARARIHEAAGTHNGLLVKDLRLVYGYLLFLPAKAALNLTELLIEEPLIALTAALIITLAVLFH